MIEENNIQQQSIHFGHLGLILSVAVLLLGVSWMKNPDLFDVFEDKSSNPSIIANLPRYYAYEPPAEFNQPLVAGVSTEGQGPMIINEDGSLTPAVEAGDVLGASTEAVVLDLDAITVRQIADLDENIKTYISALQEIEGGYLDSIQFEAALSSGDQTQINGQAQAVQVIADGLSGLAVPASLTELHKLKILQYRAALEILRNFTHADDNPELINKNLEIFLKAEQQIQEEIAELGERLDVIIK